MTTQPMPVGRVPVLLPGSPRRMLLVIGAVAALAISVAAAFASMSTAVPSETDVASTLMRTAGEIDESALAIVRDGERLVATATSSQGRLREHSIGDAQRMISDGRSLQALAVRLRESATELGNAPLQRTRVDLGLLRAKIATLRVEGDEAVAHGRAMVEHGRFMEQLAKAPGSGISVEDAAIMTSDSAYIVKAGESIRRIASTLEAATDRFERSLGSLR